MAHVKKHSPREATPEEISLNHDRGYIDMVERACAEGRDSLDMDTYLNESSFKAACCGVGGALDGVDLAMSGEFRKIMLTVRPPGHHAEHSRAMGFCIFNNAAVAARYALEKYGLERVAVFDWDVHHGNGTQHSFEDISEVFYVSVHQWPHYPGTGSFDEIGFGKGRGATLNCPMRSGSGDGEYRHALKNTIIPALDAYKPQFVLISAGYDAHRLDPLSAINLTTEFYGEMTKAVCDIAEKYAEGRVMVLLEGGYNLKALADSVEQTLLKMAE